MSTMKNENIPLNSKNCSNLKISCLKILKNTVTAIDIPGTHSWVFCSFFVCLFFNRDTISGDHIRVSHLEEKFLKLLNIENTFAVASYITC